MRLILIAALASLAAACATSEQAPPTTANQPAGAPPAEAPLKTAAGADIGTVTITPSPHGVLVRIIVQPGGLPPGWHGTHFHGVGNCDDPHAGFQASGGHAKKVENGHGLLYPYGPEGGDLPNLSVAGDGSASAEMFSTLITASELQDADGSVLIIHASPDDHTSQPIGNAGARIACAVIPK